MKRLTSLVLALLLALTMMTGAFAEAADVTGDWYGEFMGFQVTLTLNEDGTYLLEMAGMSQENGVWETNEEGNLVMDKGPDGEGTVLVSEAGLTISESGIEIALTREAPATDDAEMSISPDTTEEELQGKWQATSVIVNGMSLPISMLGQECVIEVKDSTLYLVNLVGQTELAEYGIPLTFAQGMLFVTLQVDENTSEMFGVAKLTDGTVLFEVAMDDTVMDFLMEAVPADEAPVENAEPAAAE